MFEIPYCFVTRWEGEVGIVKCMKGHRREDIIHGIGRFHVMVEYP